MTNNMDQLTVSRHNQLVQSSYELTLDERRVVELAIAKIKFGEDVPAEITISAQEFGAVFDIDNTNVYRQMRHGVERLYERSIELLNFKGHASKRVFRIVQLCDYMEAEGKIILSFSEAIKPYLKIIKEEGRYTTYRLHQVKSLSSSHAMRLFELLMEWRNRGGKMKKSVEELKRSFGALDKYKKWSEFERRVIKPAVKSLNEHTSYDVKYETVKDGRPVVAVIFYFKEKPQLSLDLYRDSEIPQPSVTH